MFVNNLRIFWPSKILLINLDQVQLKSVRAKFHVDRTKSQGGVRKTRFSSFSDFAKKKKLFTASGRGQSQSDSTPFGESGDTRFLNVDTRFGSYRQKCVFLGYSAPCRWIYLLLYAWPPKNLKDYNRVPSTAGPRKRVSLHIRVPSAPRAWPPNNNNRFNLYSAFQGTQGHLTKWNKHTWKQTKQRINGGPVSQHGGNSRTTVNTAISTVGNSALRPEANMHLEIPCTQRGQHRRPRDPAPEIQPHWQSLGQSDSRSPGAPDLNTRNRGVSTIQHHREPEETTAAEESESGARWWTTLRLWRMEDQQSNDINPTKHPIRLLKS